MKQVNLGSGAQLKASQKKIALKPVIPFQVYLDEAQNNAGTSSDAVKINSINLRSNKKLNQAKRA